MKRPSFLHLSRRSVQLAVLCATLAVPILARYANYLAARQLDRVVERFDGSLQGRALQGVDTVLLAATGLERGEGELRGADRERLLAAARSLRGSTWSFELFGFTLTDPLAALESTLASRSVRWVMLAGILVPLIATLLLGRVFCSWICPAGFLFELASSVRRFLRFLELRPGRARLWSGDKFGILALGLATSFVLGLPVLGYLYPPALLGREVHNGIGVMFDRAEEGALGFTAAGLTVASWFLLLVVAVEIALAPRLWCRALCPGGALYAFLGRWRIVRVRREAASCTRCGACVEACPMGLSPMTDRMGVDCDNCGLCVLSCGDDALGFVLAARDRPPGGAVEGAVGGKRNGTSQQGPTASGARAPRRSEELRETEVTV